MNDLVKPTSQPGGQPSDPTINRLGEKAIGQNIRATFSSLMDAPIPAEFIERLNAIAKQG